VTVLENSLRNKIVFRCDAAKSPNVGTGHLLRCLNLAKHLSKKYRIKKNKIIFICKTDKEFFLSKKILLRDKFCIKKINNKIKDNSIKEANEISKNSANILIIDRISKTNSNFYNIIKKKFKKVIIFEDRSKIRKKFDLSLNTLVFPKKISKNKNNIMGFQYLLLPITSKKEVVISKKENIFLSFGGYDHNNLCLKIVKILPKLNKKLHIFIPKIYNLNKFDISNKHKVTYYKKDQYLKYLKQCNIAIISGGLTLYDAIYLKKKIICIPQYLHQLINADKIKKYYLINIIKKDLKNFDSIMLSKIDKIFENKKIIYNRIKENNIISHKNYIKTMSYIEKVYEESFN